MQVQAASPTATVRLASLATPCLLTSFLSTFARVQTFLEARVCVLARRNVLGFEIESNVTAIATLVSISLCVVSVIHSHDLPTLSSPTPLHVGVLSFTVVCVSRTEFSFLLQGIAPLCLHGEFLGCGILPRLGLPPSILKSTLRGVAFVCCIIRSCFGSTSRPLVKIMVSILSMQLEIFFLTLYLHFPSKEHLDPSLFPVWSLSLFAAFSSYEVTFPYHTISTARVALEMLGVLATLSNKEVNDANLFLDPSCHPFPDRYLPRSRSHPSERRGRDR